MIAVLALLTHGHGGCFLQDYLATITGHVPGDMVRCLATFLDFCYLVQCNMICADILDLIKEALDQFHHYCEIFIKTGVRVDNISLLWQHSLIYYITSIILFGSPNRLCLSIMESKHIKAVKNPWCHSSHYHALLQILTINEQQDKLAAAHSVFKHKGMMQGSTLAYTAMVLWGDHSPPLPTIEDDDQHDDHGAVTGPPVMNSVMLTATVGK